MSEITSWKWCRKCQGLFFFGGSTASATASDDDDGFDTRCPVGDDHDASKSADYTLFTESSPWGVAEMGWKHCGKCDGLFLPTTSNVGTCPADNDAHDATDATAYVVPTAQPTAATAQDGWRACSKCRVLYYSGNDDSHCPAGEGHSSTGSSSYFLKFEPLRVIKSIALRWRSPADVASAAHPEDANYLYLSQRTDLPDSPIQASGVARGKWQTFKLMPLTPPDGAMFHLQAPDGQYVCVADDGRLISTSPPDLPANATAEQRAAWPDKFELAVVPNPTIPGIVVSLQARSGKGSGKYVTVPDDNHKYPTATASSVSGASEQFQRIDLDLASGGLSEVLTTTEWMTIQGFVESAKTLPITDAAFKAALRLTDDVDPSYFDKMKLAFQHINAHAKLWRTSANDGVYDNVVAHSNSIYQYAKKAIGYDPAHPSAADLEGPPKGYYGALNDALTQMIEAPSVLRRAKFNAILDGLQADAVTYAKEAGDLAKKISNFANLLADDKTELDAAHKYLNDQYAWVDKDLSTIEADLDAAYAALSADTSEYTRDVVIAATTVTYAWVPLYGNISSIVVAGVYGKRATDKLADIARDRARIATDNQQVLRDRAIMAAMKTGGNLMDDIDDQLTSALAVVQKIQGIWNAIASDLADLRDRVLPSDIKKAKAILKDLGIAEAIVTWREVGRRADQFRVNAYVTIQAGTGTGG